MACHTLDDRDLLEYAPAAYLNDEPGHVASNRRTRHDSVYFDSLERLGPQVQLFRELIGHGRRGRTRVEQGLVCTKLHYLTNAKGLNWLPLARTSMHTFTVNAQRLVGSVLLGVWHASTWRGRGRWTAPAAASRGCGNAGAAQVFDERPSDERHTPNREAR